MENRGILRKGTLEDVDAVSRVEALCFPPAEAATRERMEERLRVFGDHFLLLYEDHRLIGFIDGMVTKESILTDEMFADASLHDATGDWQMIFGLNTLPEYRRQGHGGRMIRAFIHLAKEEGRKGVVLTAKAEKVPYYETFGFVNEGVSESEHGGVTWYLMRLTF